MSLKQNKAYSKEYQNTTKKRIKRENKSESKSSEEYDQKNVSEIKENKKRKTQSKFQDIESTKIESEKMEDDTRENRFLRRRTLAKKDSEEDDSQEHTIKTREKNNTQKLAFVNTDSSDSESEGGKGNRLLRKKTLRNKDFEKEESKEYTTKKREKNNRQTITLVNLDISDSESDDESIIETKEKLNDEKKERTIFAKTFNQRLHESDLQLL